ncbi:hypothetical protein HGP16_18305 [Rhizobium sp. P40RR-XXII]|uniref:hypothetical protein n=1 Tax=unclassified Rhizobium TaxID=2613769 RepID=UPI001457243C|nr:MULTISPECIES: hypothetical protein [unclassified Rhizobium]NLR87855.1 hypothetical protein [Rhizobium sp. P28RR-XV]NLS18515.1 hypothetical protein [Rhizobium sp. P40RR-XXII]
METGEIGAGWMRSFLRPTIALARIRVASLNEAHRLTTIEAGMPAAFEVPLLEEFCLEI